MLATILELDTLFLFLEIALAQLAQARISSSKLTVAITERDLILSSGPELSTGRSGALFYRPALQSTG